MRFTEFDRPSVGDILEIEIGDEIVETVITEISGEEIIVETDNVDGGNLILENIQQGVAEGNRFDEPLTGYHIVYRNSGNPVLNTPSFETKDQAQKYLMTKMFANHQDFKVVHTANVGMAEAEYQGRTVKLGKPMQGDVKKFKVYVRNPATGKTVKVNFGDPNMRIKKSNPARRRSFRARHNCANPGPRTKARYWSCRKW